MIGPMSEYIFSFWKVLTNTLVTDLCSILHRNFICLIVSTLAKMYAKSLVQTEWVAIVEQSFAKVNLLYTFEGHFICPVYSTVEKTLDLKRPSYVQLISAGPQ